MQDAQLRIWTREPLMSAELLESVHELNHRFLDLVGMAHSDWSSSGRAGLSVDVSGQVAPLSSAQKKAAANCPYALFDLGFYDGRHWRSRLQTIGRWNVADETSGDENTLEFVRLALFFAWHVASTATLAAKLLLGMSEDTAAAFRGATIDCLPSLVVTEAPNLTARWSNCPSYWGALTEAAARPNSKLLRRIQLYGLQLAAAASLA